MEKMTCENIFGRVESNFDSLHQVADGADIVIE